MLVGGKTGHYNEIRKVRQEEKHASTGIFG